MLVCPDCGHSLLAKRVITHSWGRVEVDQCPFCAGIWFDHFEVNQVPLSEIKRLSKEKPKLKPGEAIGEGKCPHCLVALVPLRSESVPKYLNVLSCPQCRGNWFSQKNLFAFKKAQKAKIDYFKRWRIPLPSTFSVLLPVLVLVALTLTIPAILIKLKEQEEIRIRAGEVLIKPTVIKLNPTLVIVTWATTAPVTSEIKYWTQDLRPKTITVSEILSTNHIVELKNLTPKVDYFYQLILKDKEGNLIPSTLYSFTTK